MRVARGLRLAGAAVGGTAAVVAGQAAYVRVKFVLPPDASGPTSGVASATAAPAAGTTSLLGRAFEFSPSQRKEAQARRKNIIFLGDSLVTGVGCDHEAGQGPTLPRAVAQELSGRLGADVGWLALGETGADILSLSSRLMPSLAREVERCYARGERVDAVVIVCGLNDMKSCFLFCQPHLNPVAFAANLKQVIASVRDITGEDCAVVLPGVNVVGVPRFAPFWPLSAFISAAADMWEVRKERVAAELAAEGARVAFSSGKGVQLDASSFCRDGMHPNDRGYQFWAALMAEDLMRALGEGPITEDVRCQEL
jgi:lysophospholipase L1-like esterase